MKKVVGYYFKALRKFEISFYVFSMRFFYLESIVWLDVRR